MRFENLNLGHVPQPKYNCWNNEYLRSQLTDELRERNQSPCSYEVSATTAEPMLPIVESARVEPKGKPVTPLFDLMDAALKKSVDNVAQVKVKLRKTGKTKPRKTRSNK